MINGLLRQRDVGMDRGIRETIDRNLSIKLLPGVLSHNPEHGEERPAKVVKVRVIIVWVKCGFIACRAIRAMSRCWRQRNGERLDSPHPPPNILKKT